jgi:F0F1-type ATP synthase epsilon subunit
MTKRQDASTGEPVETDDSAEVNSSHDPTMMRVKVYSPYQVYYDSDAVSISAINETGPFDILKGHHRFLTLLQPCELVIDGKDGEEKIKISRGIMYVKEDRVTVFLDV